MMKVRMCRVHCSHGSTCCVSRIRVFANAECNVQYIRCDTPRHRYDDSYILYIFYRTSQTRNRVCEIANANTQMRRMCVQCMSMGLPQGWDNMVTEGRGAQCLTAVPGYGGHHMR
jgi:hypothetical protein